MPHFPRTAAVQTRKLVWALVCVLWGAPQIARANWPGSPATNVPVCTAPGAAGFRNAVSDGVGGLLVAWTDTRSDSADIYVQRMTGGGVAAWATNGVLACGALSDQDQASVASDGSGGAIVAWRDLRDGPTGDLYAQHVTASGSIAWAQNGVKVCGAPNEQANPVLVPDGFGGAVIIWEDNRSGVAIYAQRLRADGRPMWAADGVRLSNDTSPQFEPTACSDGFGGAIVGWAQQSASGYDVVAQGVDIQGGKRWGVAGVAVCTAAGNQVHAQLVSDNAGGAVICWEDYRSGTADIYAQRLNLYGLTYFNANGTPACTVTGDQRWPQLATDGASGAIMTWQDERAGEGDLYAQRWSGSSGARLWSVAGEIVCNAPGPQQFASITRDGNGGAIITWEDGRNGPSDIFAQRLSPLGARQWGTGGLLVSSAPGSQYQPVVAPDEDSVVVIVWTDQRTGGSDLYAQGIPFAITLDAPAGTPQGRALSAVPEPLSERTELRFKLPRAGRVELLIHDAAGRRVRTLVRGSSASGPQHVTWDGRDDQGVAQPGGVYFARILLDGGAWAGRTLRLVR
ncbi:MAG: FlgD immunoglobulin-like domain containing protein [Candidatus Eisenbacteria bacterium]